jgi:hypothetical protein
MTNFKQSKIMGEATNVPEIRPEALVCQTCEWGADEWITTTYRLIKKFISLKGKDISVSEHVDPFWYFLHKKGITAH